MKMKSFIPVALAAFFFIAPPAAEACTNILVTKGASKTGSTMISYSADSHLLYGELYHTPAGRFAPGTMLPVYEWDSGNYLGEIAQVAQTYSTIGNMNEYGLLIGETTFGGRSELVDETGIMDYGSLIYITLQRAKTAREAIQVMADLTNQYGYRSSGESFSIADKDEVWILEMIGKGDAQNKGTVWVAVRVPDGMISAHANQARIRQFPLNDPENCVYSKDVISFAKEKGYYQGADKDFAFCDAYAPLDFSALRACEARVWAAFNMFSNDMDQHLDYAMGHNKNNPMPLWIKPTRQLDVKDVDHIMRDHYDGTPMDMHNDIGAGGHSLPYRWRPMDFEVDGVTYVNERAIATQQTGFWFVGEVRGWLPPMLSGILWFGVDDAGTSCLTPIYSASNRVPECFAVGNGDMITYSPTSAFWLFNRVTNAAYLRYDMMSEDILKVSDQFLTERMEEIPAIDAAAKTLYDQDPEKARTFLANYSVSTAQNLFTTWDQLDKYLLVKYIDGNVKRERDGQFESTGQGRGIPMPIQPGYNEKWKRAVAEDHGDVLKVVPVE